MKAIEVEIHNYKSICIDIKECKLRLDNAVTFLVGANESGKTNILEALNKFSRGGFEDIDIPYMCPYSGESEPPTDLRMVSVTYDIEETDRKALGQIHKSLEKAKEIKLTRNYAGGPYIVSPELREGDSLKQLLSGLRKVTSDFGSNFRKYSRQYKRARRATASSTRSALFRLNSLLDQTNLLIKSFDKSKVAPAQKRIKRLRSSIESLDAPLDSLENMVINPLNEIEMLVNKLSEYMELAKISEKVWEIVPKFELVPANPELWLRGEYYVDDILNDETTDEKLVSVKRLLDLAELNLNSTRNKRPLLQTVTLNNAANKISTEIRELWEQEPDIQVKFEWDPEEGNRKLLVMIESDGHRGHPQYRSLGFRWFLEFYLLYAAGLRRNTVLMFEEPGIHLHSDGQNNLKRVIRSKVSTQCQVVYTTHSPDMCDTTYPEGCRAVAKESGVTKVEDTYSPEHQYTTWGAAMKALGINAALLRMFRKNIITEGPADWIFILTMAQILAKSSSDLIEVSSGIINIFPCQGTKTIPHTVPFFFQPGVKSVVLLDSDQAGNAAKDKLERQFNPPSRYLGKIIMVNDVIEEGSELGKGEHELEDLLGTKYYAELVSGWLGEGKLNVKDFKSANMIAKQAANLVKVKYGRDLKTDGVAWYFRDRVLDGNEEVGDKIKTRFENLILKLVAEIRDK